MTHFPTCSAALRRLRLLLTACERARAGIPPIDRTLPTLPFDPFFGAALFDTRTHQGTAAQ